MTQLELILEPIPPRDPSVRAEEAPRLSRQCHEIYSLLKTRTATNDELAKIARKYTSRISDIRAVINPRGEDVVVLERDYQTGLVVYGLKSFSSTGKVSKYEHKNTL